MKYVYPKFDGINLIFFRIGGSGLGNLLYPFFRSLVYSKKENLEIISPTFKSLKIGPYLRNEKQKRLYPYNYKNSIGGFKKLFLLLFRQKIKYIGGFGDGFNSLYGFEKFLRKEFISLIDKEIDISKFKNAICCHIRLGDFKKSEDGYVDNNTRIPLSWYIKVINTIRKEFNNMKVFIFSDGTKEEMKEILELENIELETSQDPAIDILKLSASKILIGSYSSFSFWGAFFSNGMCVWHEDIFNNDEFPLNASNYIFDSKKIRLIKQN